MTNFEFYNGDAEALHKALDAVCQQEGGDCDKCRLNKPNSRCAILFICAEHEEPPKPKKRRFYSFDEAQQLLGKVVKGNSESVMITRVHLTCDGVMINGCFQRAFMDATIDGEPFGVEVEVTE